MNNCKECPYSLKTFCMICFSDFNKELLNFLLRYTIQSKELQRKHIFKDRDIVFYYDGCFSNIHRLNLKKNAVDIGLTNEVLYNTECYNENREWDLLTGIFIWLPKNKYVLSLIKKNKEEAK
uniref:Uncharacterized protein n=1 Tax=viral metagenome TaxID=1070528 RepID=A0A6H1ZMV9_9ZZZZ